MKQLCKSILALLLIRNFCTAFAQKQTFGVVSYTVPKGWQQKQNEGSVQVLATDNKTSAYIMTIITKATPSDASAIENFNNKWKAAIKDQLQLDGEPVMQPSSKGNGWDIETGSAGYTDNGVKGKVALLSATGGGQTAYVVIMSNTKQYEKDLSTFLISLELAKVVQNENSNSSSSTNVNSPLVGKIWEGASSEKFTGAGAMAGHYTGGFFSDSYRFYANGTYLFITVNASYYANTKSLKYETGTYSVHGDQLTISPASGANEEWTKIGQTSNGNSDVSNREINDTWGKKLKTTTRKLEKYTYIFNIGKNGDHTALIVQYNGQTEGEGEGKIAYLNETTHPVTLPAGFNRFLE